MDGWWGGRKGERIKGGRMEGGEEERLGLEALEMDGIFYVTITQLPQVYGGGWG